MRLSGADLHLNSKKFPSSVQGNLPAPRLCYITFFSMSLSLYCGMAVGSHLVILSQWLCKPGREFHFLGAALDQCETLKGTIWRHTLHGSLESFQQDGAKRSA